MTTIAVTLVTYWLFDVIDYVDNRVVEFSRGRIQNSRGRIQNLKDFGEKISILKGNY